MKKKFKTWLPIFTGFYHTIFDESESFVEYELDCESSFRENYEIPGDIPWEFVEGNFWEVIDYNAGNIAVAQACADTLVGLLPDFVKSVEYEKLVSPREYNFTNDAVDIAVEVDIDAIKKYLEENDKAFGDYLEETYSSRDGFRSSYPNSIEEWKDDTNDFNDLNEHYAGSILQFIACNEMEEPQMDMYHAANGSEAFSGGTTVDIARLVQMWEESKEESIEA